jgi:hypothetical protein
VHAHSAQIESVAALSHTLLLALPPSGPSTPSASTPQVDPLTCAAHRAAVAQAIRDLEALTALLKAGTNTSVPAIACLPPEVLLSVMDHCAASDFATGDTLRAVACVSRHWRALALGTPRLWTYLSFTRLAWTRTLLCRSCDAPLDVHVDLRDWCTDAEDAAAAALGHLRRLRTINIVATPQRMTNLLADLARVGCCAPLLEHLQLVNHSVDPLRIPHDALAGGAPRLASIKLVDFEIDPSHPLLSSSTQHLTHLDLSRSHSSAPESAPYLRLSALLHMLACMPELRSLRLCRVLPPAPGPLLAASEASSNNIVHLNCLETLQLVDTVSACAHFLAHIVCPADTWRRIEALCTSTDEGEELSSILGAAMPHILGNPPSFLPSEGRARTPFKMRLAQEIGRSVLFEAFPSCASSTTDFASSPRLSLLLSWRHFDPTRGARSGASICTHLARVICVREMSVERVPMDLVYWGILLRALEGELKTLSVEREAITGLVDALSPIPVIPSVDVNAPKGKADAQPIVPVSELCTLRLSHGRITHMDSLLHLRKCLLLRAEFTLQGAGAGSRAMEVVLRSCLGAGAAMILEDDWTTLGAYGVALIIEDA